MVPRLLFLAASRSEYNKCFQRRFGECLHPVTRPVLSGDDTLRVCVCTCSGTVQPRERSLRIVTAHGLHAYLLESTYSFFASCLRTAADAATTAEHRVPHSQSSTPVNP